MIWLVIPAIMSFSMLFYWPVQGMHDKPVWPTRLGLYSNRFYELCSGKTMAIQMSTSL